MLLAFTLVIANGFIGHFYAPYGIIFTPVLLPLTIGLLVFGKHTKKPIPLALGAFSLVALNDVLIKLYSGGLHDWEGYGWIQGTLLLGLFPSFILVALGVHKNTVALKSAKVLGILLFPVMVFVHLYFTSRLGLGRLY